MSKHLPVITNLADIPPRLPRLSEELGALLTTLTEQPITLNELLSVMKGRAYTLLLIIISFPFCQPIPIPGVSTFFGSIIVLIGLRLSLRLEPWLPTRMLGFQLSSKTLTRILIPAKRMTEVFEILLRPRWSFLVEYPLLRHLNGAIICLSGILLLLPLPIPFSNMLPALTVILLALAMLERDGWFVIFGLIAFITTLAFFVGIYIGGATAIHALRE